MPILVSLYHHNNGTNPYFVVLISHEARDGTFPGVVTTTDAEGPNSVALASIVGTGGIDVG